MGIPEYPLGGAPKVHGENKEKTKTRNKTSELNLKLCPGINKAQTAAHINDSYLHSLCIKYWPGLLYI